MYKVDSLFIHSLIVATTVILTTLILPVSLHAQTAGEAPMIGNTIFKNEDQWYAPQDSIVYWNPPADVTSIAVGVGTSTSFEPMNTVEPAEREFELAREELLNGVQYVALQFREDGEWGPVAYRTMQIDAEPPYDIIAETTFMRETGDPLLTITAADDESGVAGYALIFDDRDPFYYRPDTAARGIPLTGLPSGAYSVVIVAFDAVGNTAQITTPLVAYDTTGDYREAQPTRTVYLAALTALGGFTALALALLIHGYRRERKRERRLREELRELQSQTKKVFNALHDEIEEQIVTITKKSKPSKGEQRVVENLQKVLSVSKTLINKELTDIGKVIRRK